MNDATDRSVNLISFEMFQDYRQRRHNRAICGRQAATGNLDIGETNAAETDGERGDGAVGQRAAVIPAIVDIK